MSLIFWPIVSGAIANSSPLTHDPYFSSVVQLAHFDGSNGSTTFTNSCSRGNTMSQVGTASLSTTTEQWGTASLGVRDAGSSPCGARGASTADYNFSTSDFTIEFWANPDTLTRQFDSAKVYFDMRNSLLTAAWVPTISANNGTGNLRYFANGAERIAGADVMSATTWNYIALCRNSGTTRLFHGLAGGNATQVGSDFTDSNTYVQQQMSLGCAGSGAGHVIGYFDDLRVTNGVGRYTTTFTVPTGPFPNQ